MWRDPETDILCKARLDILNRQRKSIDDIKTDKNPHELEFPKTIRYNGYHVRLAHYLAGTYACLPELDIQDIRILAIKNDVPHYSLLYVLAAEDINYGLNFCAEALKTIKHCCFHGWPGPEQNEIHLAPVSI